MPIVACGENNLFIGEEKDIGNISLLNINKSIADKQCLVEKVKLIISYIDNHQVAPYKVKIWKEHTLVKDILKQETISIERDASKENILIPIKAKGQRLILYKIDKQKESYRMVGIISKNQEVDFYECIK